MTSEDIKHQLIIIRLKNKQTLFVAKKERKKERKKEEEEIN